MVTVDLDSLFEAYFRKYLVANQGKFNEDELENKVGEIYKQFGNEPLKELGGKSPRKYYADKSEEELVKELETSVKNSLPVSDFLCEELENRKGAFKYLIKFVDDAENDELATYAVNFLRYGDDVANACPAFLNMLLGGRCGDSLAETVTEVLSEHAETVTESAVKAFNGASEKIKAYLAEILSCAPQSDGVYEILKHEFSAHPKDAALYGGYLAKYGDERAVEVINAFIRQGGLSAIDYKELRMAVEALGGEAAPRR